jgi:hypothetical protein
MRESLKKKNQNKIDVRMFYIIFFFVASVTYMNCVSLFCLCFVLFFCFVFFVLFCLCFVLSLFCFGLCYLFREFYHYFFDMTNIFFTLLNSVNETPQAHSIALLSRALHLLQLQITEVWAHATNEQVKQQLLGKITKARKLKQNAKFGSFPPSSAFSLLLQLRGKFPQLKDTLLWIMEKCFAVDPQLKGTIDFLFYFFRSNNGQNTSNKSQKTENRKPKTENRKPKTENRKPKTGNLKRET